MLYNSPGSPLIDAAPTYTDWIAGYDVAGQTGFTQDPDGDGIENGLEAWFGTRPDEFSPGLTSPATDGMTTTFSHPGNENPPSDVTSFYEWSVNLLDWYAGDGVDGPVGGLTIGITPEYSGETATVTATASEASGHLFLRVGAQQN